MDKTTKKRKNPDPQNEARSCFDKKKMFQRTGLEDKMSQDGILPGLANQNNNIAQVCGYFVVH